MNRQTNEVFQIQHFTLLILCSCDIMMITKTKIRINLENKLNKQKLSYIILQAYACILNLKTSNKLAELWE